jgi:hypothetical protein
VLGGSGELKREDAVERSELSVSSTLVWCGSGELEREDAVERLELTGLLVPESCWCCCVSVGVLLFSTCLISLVSNVKTVLYLEGSTGISELDVVKVSFVFLFSTSLVAGNGLFGGVSLITFGGVVIGVVGVVGIVTSFS